MQFDAVDANQGVARAREAPRPKLSLANLVAGHRPLAATSALIQFSTCHATRPHVQPFVLAGRGSIQTPIEGKSTSGLGEDAQPLMRLLLFVL